MHQRALACTAVAAILAGVHAHTAASRRGDPFAFFQPPITVDVSDRERLARGDVIVRVLPARDGELSVFAASRLDTSPEALVTWTHAIAQLKQSAFVLAIRRFSDPPVLEDLNGLVLDEGDVDAIARCRAGDCAVHLGAHEIQSLRAAAAAAGQGWRGPFSRSSGGRSSNASTRTGRTAWQACRHTPIAASRSGPRTPWPRFCAARRIWESGFRMGRRG